MKPLALAFAAAAAKPVSERCIAASVHPRITGGEGPDETAGSGANRSARTPHAGNP